MDVNLQGRTALVTGAAGGIGFEYARGLAAAGAGIVVADVNGEGADAAAKALVDEGGRALAVTVDISSKESVDAMVASATEMFGAVDILVNNAAIYHSLRFDPQMTVDIAYWRQIFSVNLDGALLCTQAVAPGMIERGWGRIVNQASIAAYTGTGGVYGVAKLALIGLTQGFATELGPHGVTCNAIAPGVVMTEATKATIPDVAVQQVVAMQPVPRALEAFDLVGTLLYLASDAAAYVSGQTLLVDGGLIKRI